MRCARQPSIRLWRVVLGTLVMLCAGAAAWPSRAAAAPRAVGNGLRVEADIRWPGGTGYRPLVITVTPLRPLTADRTLTFQAIRSRFPWQTGYDLRVVKHVELPAGAGPVSTTLSVPSTAAEGRYVVEVSEEGTPLPRLRLDWGEASMYTMDEDVLVEYLPHVLWVGKDMDDLLDLSRVFDRVPSSGSLGRLSATTSSLGGSLPTTASFPIEDLPEQWIDYTSVDVAATTLSELADLRRQRPAAFESLRRWVFAGGNLWVLGMEDDWQGLERLDALLEFPAAPPAAAGKPGGWQQPSRQSDSSTLFGDPGAGYYDEDFAVEVAPEPLFLETDTPDSQPAGPPQTPDRSGAETSKNAPFRLRPLGLGLVVAIAADGPDGLDARQWRWVFNEVGPERWQWPQRFGLSTVQPNDHFWDFLIPGVGLAPVAEFYVLITLFVVGIGPVNYWVLRRWKRVHLLMFTVPGGAAAVTGLLLLYAVVADGLGVRTRVRSVTCLDQRTGTATCWARVSYYAGLAPSRGLVFPADVAVIPLEPMGFHPYRRSGAHRRRDLVLEPDGTQRLASGWLASRTPTQFVTVRSRATRTGLQIAPAPGKPEQWTLTNRLGVRVEQVLVCPEEGKYGWAAEVEPDASVLLRSINASEGLERLRRTCRQQRMGWPEGMTDVPSNTGWGGSWRWFGSSLPTPTDRASRLEQTLGAVTAARGGNLVGLGPRDYVAVVAQSLEVELGTPKAREEDSLHVIVGNW